MKISETLQKSSPLIPKREMSKTEYMKLVDANTELVDKMNDLKERIDKAIELLNENYNAFFIEEDANYIGEGCYHDLLNILKGDNND